MATALFQCTSPTHASEISRYIKNLAPSQILNVQTFDNLVSMSFHGGCTEMYWWGMEVALSSWNTVSFIGIDESTDVPDDPYKVMLIGDIPFTKSLRTSAQRSYFNILVNDFLTTIKGFDIEESVLFAICKQSVLGEDRNNSLTYCYKAVKTCQIYGHNCQYKDILDGRKCATYSSRNNNTIVRIMAHICYLGRTVCKRNNPVASLFGKVAGALKG